jgi:hypothetical protein
MIAKVLLHCHNKVKVGLAKNSRDIHNFTTPCLLILLPLHVCFILIHALIITWICEKSVSSNYCFMNIMWHNVLK